MKIENHIHLLIQNTRFAPDLVALLAHYTHIGDINIESILRLLLEDLRNPQLMTIDPAHPAYAIPEEIIKNNAQVREHVLDDFEGFLEHVKKNQRSFTQFVDFVVAHHEPLKWAMNKWLLVPPGITLEINELPETLPEKLLEWLHEKWDIVVGDKVIYPHIISPNGRKRLRNMGFLIPTDHLHRDDYKNSLDMASKILTASQCKGIFSMSWIYAPQNFALASDGKPYAAFSFLQEHAFIGYSYDVTKLISQEEYDLQYAFALRNERRKALVNRGEFVIKVYAVFYPTGEVLTKNI